MIDQLAQHLLAMPAWVVLLFVFLVPALEASAFVGFVFPGEIALVLGGVLAFQGRAPLPAVLACGILGAVLGDAAGYFVGRRWGRAVLDGSLGRFVKAERLDRGERYLRERGGRAVFLGRFTAALRVTIPSLSGMSRLPFRTFALYNVAGAVCWGTLVVLLGYLGGRSWRHVAHLASRLGLAALALVLLAALVGYLAGRGRGRRLLARVAGSDAVAHQRDRHPRTAGWLADRLRPADPRGLPLTLTVVVGVLAAWLFGGLTQDVLAHEELARRDAGIHAWALAHRTPFLTEFFRSVTWLGANAVVVPLLLVAGVWLVRARRSLRPVVPVVVVYVVVELAHALVQVAVHRARPPRADWLSAAGGWSYPSGHSMQAVAAWGLLALLVADTPVRRSLKVAVALLSVTVALCVGMSRVYLGVHWPTDVLGGGSLSVALLAVWFTVRLRGRAVDPGTPPSAARHPGGVGFRDGSVTTPRS